MIAMKMTTKSFIAAAFLLSIGLTRAEVKMPAIFGDHMVLQQGTKIPVWGWASPGETVTVTFGGKTVATTAAADGSWRVDLPRVSAANATPQNLDIAGTNSVTFHDVLVGDVWLASGQSNMEFGIGNVEQPAVEIAKANEPKLRLFCAPKATALTPQKDLGAPATASSANGLSAHPKPSAMAGPWNGFSAVAYYFGREIQHVHQSPRRHH